MFRLDWVGFNVPLNTLYIISGMGFYGSNDLTDSVKALKEVVVLRIGFNPTRSTSSCYNPTHAYNIQWYTKYTKTRMWANAQYVGCPAEYRWRPLFNAAVSLTPSTRVPCGNAAKKRNPLKLAGVPQTNETISATSRTHIVGTCGVDIAV